LSTTFVRDSVGDASVCVCDFICLDITCNWKEVSSQFHQHFMSSFCANILLLKNTNQNSDYRKATWSTLACIKCWWNWLYGSMSSTFYKPLLRWYYFAKKLQSHTVIREKVQKRLLYEKVLCKLLMKLTQGGGGQNMWATIAGTFEWILNYFCDTEIEGKRDKELK